MLIFLNLVTTTDAAIRSFYYADERTAEGKPVYGNISGDAHADFYFELAQKQSQGPWMATFVKDEGYIAFPHPGL